MIDLSKEELGLIREWYYCIRDHFAGLAMQGQWANDIEHVITDTKVVAEWAYGQADAMLEARNATKKI